jgi:tetratricopeptide (TPR) repeat protein
MHLKKIVYFFAVLVCFASLTAFPVKAQTEEEVKEALVKGLVLFKQQQYIEALPHLELLVKVMPEEAKLHFLYGFSLVAKSKQITNGEEAKQLSAKALEEFKTAKKLGMNDQMNDGLIKLLSGTSSPEEATVYSKNSEANKLVNQGENYFAQSKYDDAISAFQKALALDGNIYQAAISLGDCYVFKQDWANAEKSYQKAIAIDPTRETAYRYSATPFMRQEKYEQARDRYIEAWITEPYSQMSPRGISQWADVTGAKLGHPKVNFPDIKFDEQGRALMEAPVSNPNYNSEWKGYLAARIDWRKNKFAKTFPAEKEYRHTLQEEVEAVRNALKIAKEEKLSHPQFEILQKLDGEGLLEAYVLMAQADEGIAQDHENYLKANRPKMRQYVLNYVIQTK